MAPPGRRKDPPESPPYTISPASSSLGRGVQVTSRSRIHRSCLVSSSCSGPHHPPRPKLSSCAPESGVKPTRPPKLLSRLLSSSGSSVVSFSHRLTTQAVASSQGVDL